MGREPNASLGRDREILSHYELEMERESTMGNLRDLFQIVQAADRKALSVK